jgi:hypothetical protein
LTGWLVGWLAGCLFVGEVCATLQELSMAASMRLLMPPPVHPPLRECRGKQGDGMSRLTGKEVVA